MEKIIGKNAPAEIAVRIEDRAALIGQYLRHVDSGEIYKITEAGQEGVTAYQVEGFGAPVSKHSTCYLITWTSLKHKHRIMVHVADIAANADQII